MTFPERGSALVAATGRSTLHGLGSLGRFALFVIRAYPSVLVSRGWIRRWIGALHEQGVRCLPVVLIVGTFTGLVLGLQGHSTLSDFGSASLLGQLVALTLIRELAPVLSALMLVGQAGSALTAELGIQRNGEQIDALETMGINPLGYLVAPRLLAALCVYPIMSLIFSLVGLWGGYLSGSLLLSLPPGVYWSSVHRSVVLADLGECLLKALVFGFITMALCAYQGFFAHRQPRLAGARAVSSATTRAVVFSSIGILASDYALTSLLP